MVAPQERIKSLDVLKGIAIVLVLFGHAIQKIDMDPYNDRLFNYIYSFHMPLFMFVSGYFSWKIVRKWSDIKKRAYQLLTLFLCTLLYVPYCLKIIPLVF